MSRLFIKSFYNGVEYNEQGTPVASCLVVVTNGVTELPVEVPEESFNNLMQLALEGQEPSLEEKWDETFPSPEEPVQPLQAFQPPPEPDMDASGTFERTRPAPAGDFDAPPGVVLHDTDIDPGELHSAFDGAEGAEQI